MGQRTSSRRGLVKQTKIDFLGDVFVCMLLLKRILAFKQKCLSPQKTTDNSFSDAFLRGVLHWVTAAIQLQHTQQTRQKQFPDRASRA